MCTEFASGKQVSRETNSFGMILIFLFFMILFLLFLFILSSLSMLVLFIPFAEFYDTFSVRLEIFLASLKRRLEI